ncbi:hypothetical protein SEA_VANLEE_135 [Gordonia phage VanLee]|uniref:Uncharacterized protein n=1 Tax=Gordonia phage VanLee TaxID=2845816 RepID=A0A8F2IF98_9CAUD|nr:hypothetical protein QEH49_gp155 [Gordonia phage VanLee]QWS68251.1 hypothetical protein SEA_VANLEE_135 [Gordonia phage VanLee]
MTTVSIDEKTFTDLDLAFVHAVRRLVAEAPEFVYEAPDSKRGCVYIVNGCGSCIVGQALIEVGFTPERVGSYDPHGKHSAKSAADAMAGLGGFSWQVRRWADQLQDVQDGENPWGTALAEANRYFPDVEDLP